MLKINEYCTNRYPKKHTHSTFQLNPFSSVGGVVSTRLEFNRRGRLGAVTQNLSRGGRTKYTKNHTHKISAQSVQWFMRNRGQQI